MESSGALDRSLAGQMCARDPSVTCFTCEERIIWKKPFALIKHTTVTGSVAVPSDQGDRGVLCVRGESLVLRHRKPAFVPAAR